MKNAIIIHLYYQDLWQEFADKLKELPKDFDLYVSIVDTHNDITFEIQKDFPDAKVFRLPNKGLDVGPFLLILEYIIENNLNYNVLFKLHTKKSNHCLDPSYGQKWRHILIKHLIGTKSMYETIIKAFDENAWLGMCAAHSFILKEEYCHWMADLMEALDVRAGEAMFVAGTMFAVRYSIYKEFFKEVNLKTLYNLLDEGYVQDRSNMHKLERIFSFIVNNMQYGILGLKEV